MERTGGDRDLSTELIEGNLIDKKNKAKQNKKNPKIFYCIPRLLIKRNPVNAVGEHGVCWGGVQQS